MLPPLVLATCGAAGCTGELGTVVCCRAEIVGLGEGPCCKTELEGFDGACCKITLDGLGEGLWECGLRN